jgi:hypothetical protein
VSLVSKQWKPGKQVVELEAPPRPSRIRRQNVQPIAATARKVEPPSTEQEMWQTILGVLLFALTGAVLVWTISAWTTSGRNAAADDAAAEQFGQCYSGGTNCVVDGSTIFVAGSRVMIAGIDAPHIRDARCEAERTQGIDAAMKLASLLNSGKVVVGDPEQGGDGAVRRYVLVDGKDVGGLMIDSGSARKLKDTPASWC